MPTLSRLGVAVAALLSCTVVLLAQPQAPAAPPRGRVEAPANIDTRAAFRPRTPARPGPEQVEALERMRAAMPELRVEMDPYTGATRSIWNVGGFLTSPDGRDAGRVAADFIAAQARLLGLADADLVEAIQSDRVHSAISGVTHVYFQQTLGGVPVYNAQLHVNVAADGRILSVNNQFVPNLVTAVRSLRPAQPAAAAVGRVAALQGGAAGVPRLVREEEQTSRRTVVFESGMSAEPIVAGLVIVPVSRGVARLAWNFQVHPPGEAHAFDYTVDAESGVVWTRVDWVAADQYLVYPRPIESPSHATPAPPADGRTLAVNPAHNIASPDGWHYVPGLPDPQQTTTRGNNVHAYTDRDGNNEPDPGGSPDCGSGLDCSFPMDLTQPPATYQAASVAHVFYWANLVHDVQHRYGFDEAAGNFQEHNYTGQGAGSDSLRAEAQDRAAMAPSINTRNNAFFTTPPDGDRPRLELMAWNYTAPERDGSLDAGIIVHEYGHGISNRLVGGPGNVNCLANVQQPGEGISDWLALVYTARATDTPGQGRGIGTYGLGQPPTGLGIRTKRYSTDPAINDWTYESIADPALSVPHGVGSVWAQAMWKAYWALVEHHGFSSNLHDANGGAGNQRAMLYHNEGLKNTACGPTFTDVRDGIIQAAQVINDGADVCRLWDAFASFGLGIDAVSGGPDSRHPRNGFNKPVACGGVPIPTLSVDDIAVAEGDAGLTNAVFTVSLSNATPTPVTVSYRTENGTAVSDVLNASRSNHQVIQIPVFEPTAPYPSTITVPAGAGVVQAVAVTLHGLTHGWPEDLDVLLEGPGGQTVLLMSDVGGQAPVAQPVSLTFRDDAAEPVPTTGLPSGSYRPTNVGDDDGFAAPAPSGPYGDRLSAFAGQPASGTWRLYVVDDVPGDGGQIASGWTLHLGTAGNDFVASGGTLTIPGGQTTATVAIPVIGDLLPEGPETFRLLLASPTAATIADGVGVATIVDDDDPDQLPEPPEDVRVAGVSGNTVTLTWTPPGDGAPPTGYVIEGGLSPGQVLASIPTGSTAPGLTFAAPSGSFFVRVHTLWGSFRSAASNEVVLHVNVPVPPAAPDPFLGVVDGATLSLAWQGTHAGGAATTFVLDVTGDIETTLPLGRAERVSFAGVPAGEYTLRLRAVNAAGSSPPTAPLAFTFPQPCGGAPGEVSHVRAFAVGRTVYVRWDLPSTGPAPASFVVQVGGAYVGSFAAVGRELTGVAAPGTYELRVVPVNACGSGPASSPLTVVVE